MNNAVSVNRLQAIICNQQQNDIMHIVCLDTTIVLPAKAPQFCTDVLSKKIGKVKYKIAIIKFI